MRHPIELISGDEVDGIEQAWLRERPDTPVGSIGVISRIRRLALLLDQDRRGTLTRLGLDAGTLDLLSTLRLAGRPYELAPSELAVRSLVSQAAISQRVAKAEGMGLVVRRRADADGRGVVVTLTDAGHELVEQTADELLRHDDDLLAALTPEQRRQLAGLLRVLLTSLTGRLTERRAG